MAKRSGEGWVRHDDVTLVNPQSQARAVARVWCFEIPFETIVLLYPGTGSYGFPCDAYVYLYNIYL